MELRDAVTLPALLGMSLANAAVAAAQEARHGRDLRMAQAWVDHSAGQAYAAHNDYLALVEELRAVRHEAAVLRAALEESDRENLALTLDIRRMRLAQ